MNKIDPNKRRPKPEKVFFYAIYLENELARINFSGRLYVLYVLRKRSVSQCCSSTFYIYNKKINIKNITLLYCLLY